MSKQLIIGLVGRMVAGKGTVAEYLKTKHAAHIYGYSQTLRDCLVRLNQPVTRENLSHLSTALRQIFGNDLLAKNVVADIKKDDAPIIVLDGIRRLDDIVYARAVPGFVLVKVTTDPQIRYQRLRLRQQNQDDQKKTYEEFLANEQLETEITIDPVMAQAEYEINNNGDREALQNNVDRLIDKLLVENSKN